MTDFSSIYAAAHDSSTTLVEIEGAIWLIYPSDPDENGEVTALIYSAESWEAAAAPEAQVDADGEAAFLSGDGRPYRWAAIHRAETEAQARDYLRAWTTATKADE